MKSYLFLIVLSLISKQSFASETCQYYAQFDQIKVDKVFDRIFTDVDVLANIRVLDVKYFTSDGVKVSPAGSKEVRLLFPYSGDSCRGWFPNRMFDYSIPAKTLIEADAVSSKPPFYKIPDESISKDGKVSLSIQLKDTDKSIITPAYISDMAGNNIMEKSINELDLNTLTYEELTKDELNKWRDFFYLTDITELDRTRIVRIPVKNNISEVKIRILKTCKDQI